MIGTFPTASQVLRKALNIGIKGDKFIQVKLGDIRVLICNDYLGKNNQNKVHDFFIVDGVPTLFIFSDPLTNEHVKRDIRVSRIMELFSILVQLMNTQEYYNLVDSIYAKVIESAPVVMTVKLIKAVYERNFVYDKDWNPDLYANMGWFNQDVVDAVYQFGMTELLNYGAIVLHIDAYCNEE